MSVLGILLRDLDKQKPGKNFVTRKLMKRALHLVLLVWLN